jgi:hypothetical protein
MSIEFKVNIGIDGVRLETAFGLETWSKESLGFDYGNWKVYIDSNEIDYISYDLTLQFTDDGKILFSCDNYHCDDEDEEDIEECCEYKNLEITGSHTIQNDYFFIKFIKSQKSTK